MSEWVELTTKVLLAPVLSGVIWFVHALFKARADLDAAFIKLRALEDRLDGKCEKCSRK